MARIIFMGTPEFSVPILEALIEQYDVVGVVTQPDRPVGRKRVLTPSPVKVAAEKHAIPLFQPEKIGRDEEVISALELLHADIIITAAFGQFLSERVLNIAPVLNVHASLLPKYRGGAPVHEAIIQGESETGVTIMETVKQMDAGPIISQKAIPITKQDDVGTMFDKLSLLGRDLLLETLPDYLAGKLHAVSQDETKVTFSPNITKERERIDWHMTAEQIDCHVRGMRPWPVSYTMYDGSRWKLWDVTPLEGTTTEAPGTIVDRTKKMLTVACGEGTLLTINELQPSGKGKQTIQAFLNGTGQSVAKGDVFDE